jgi:hypothetical protein
LAFEGVLNDQREEKVLGLVRIEEGEKEKARERQLSKLKQGNNIPVKEKFPEREREQTRDIVASKVDPVEKLPQGKG